MRHHAIVPLDSFGLAKYSVQVRCIVCQGDNMFDAERCRKCEAPMSISLRSAEQKKRPPRFIASLGASGSGKTVFLATMIDILARHAGELQLLARGAFPIALQQHVMQGLQASRFPAPTSPSAASWSWMHCQLKRRRKTPMDVVIPDFCGDALSRELEQPHSQPVVRAFLRQSKAALVFVDAERLSRGDSDPDYETMKTVGYLSETRSSRRRLWGPQPVAIVFTKSDKVNTEDGAVQFAKDKAPGLFRHCRERFRNHQFFFASVAAQTVFEGDLEIPLRIEPKGVEAPLKWLARRI